MNASMRPLHNGCTFLVATVLILSAITVWAQKEMWESPPPPALADWVTPFVDPLSTEPAVLHQTLQYPQSLYGGEASVCATADYAAQAHTPELAAQRLLVLTNRRGLAGDTVFRNEAFNETPELTLLLALDLGLCHNPQVRGTWSEIRQRASEVGQAKAAYLPTINAALTRQRSTTTYSRYPDQTIYNSSGYINLNWRILDFGARRATLESANYQLAAAVYTQNATLQKAIIDIVQAYYNAQSAQAAWRAREQMTEITQQLLASAQRRESHGEGSLNDILQAKSALARAQLEESRSHGDYLKNIAELTYLAGLVVNTPFTLEKNWGMENESVYTPEFNKSSSMLIGQALQDWLEQAKLHHPAIASARVQWHAAQSNIDAVRAQGLPTLDFSANYYRNGRPTESASNTRSSERNVALTITIPLFNGFDHTYRVRQAQAQAEAQRAQMEMVEQQILLEIVRAYSDAQTAWNTLTAAELLYTTAKEALDSSQRQFDKGAVDITQVLQAQNNLIEASMQRIDAQANWLAARLTLVVQGYSWEQAQ